MAQIVTAKNGQTNGIEYPRTVKSALLNDDGTPLNPLTQTNIINDLTTGGETNVLSAQQGVALSSAIGQNTSDLDAHKADVATQITSLANGSPKGTYADLTALTTAFPTGNTNIYITLNNGNWNYWNGSAWAAGGAYQSTGIPYDSITLEQAKYIIKSTNRFDKANTDNKDGYYINSSGSFLAATDYYTTHKIPIKNGDVIRRNTISNETLNGALYDANGVFLAKISTASIIDNAWQYTINNPSAAFIRLSLHWLSSETNKDTLMVTVNNSIPNEYEAYSNKIDSALTPVNVSINVLNNKTALFNGDSICAGSGYTGGYAKIIGENNSMSIVNYGISGGTIGFMSGKHCISRDVPNMQDTADYIIFQGGINDYWNKSTIPFGVITDRYDSTFDDTTFCGALENLFKQAELKWKGKKIGFIITHKVYDTFYPNPDSGTKGFENYRVAMIKICDKWSIPYLDLYIMSGMNYGLTDIKLAYSKNNDGCHPNEAGYRVFLVPKIEAWMKTL